MTPSRFSRRLALITAGALAFRLGYVTLELRNATSFGDGFYYHNAANLIAKGKLFIDPFKYSFAAIRLPSAAHPPLYTAYLASWSVAGVTSEFGHRLASCFLGAATVFVLGLLGRRLGGERTGLIAAGLAAVYPQLWLNDGLLAAETATALAVALFVLAVERYRDAPSWWRAAVVGAAAALATLGRAELSLLLLLIALPLVALGSGVAARIRLQRLGACAVAAVVVLGPWVGWNLGRFHHPELVSTGFGPAVYAGTCDRAFSGSLIGYWGGLDCKLPAVTVPDPAPSTLARWKRDPEGSRTEMIAYYQHYLLTDRDAHGRLRDESDVDIAARNAAVAYVKQHEKRALLVLLAREGRIWNVFKVTQNIQLDASVDGRGINQARLACVAYFLYTAFAIAGLVVLHRRRHAIWPYIMLVVGVCIAVALTYGIQRFRIPVDTVVPALAAVAIDARWRTLRPAV